MLICALRKMSRAEQSRAEQSRAEQSRAEQSRAEQSRAEQSSSLNSAVFSYLKKSKTLLTQANSLFFVLRE